MSTFSYTAIDRQGRRTSGVVPADSRAAAMDDILGRGLSPISVTEAAGKIKGAAGSPRRLTLGNPNKVPAKAVESFTRELANLLAAGLSLSRSLSLLKREASNPAAKAAWTKIHDDVVGGQSLADTMAKMPQAFSGVYIAMVRAGESGGFLHVVLQQISDFRQRERDLVGKVRAALIYPCVLAFVASGVLIFLLTFFVPKFSDMFAQFGSKLPLLTQIVVGISTWLIHYGPFIAIGVLAAGFALRKWAKTDKGSRLIERALLATPALGTVIARFALVRFSRMLGTLIGSGVPLISSLRTAKEAIGNKTLSDAVAHAIEQVQRGTPLSQALSINTQLFPASVIEMIAVAEETSRVDKELVRLSVTYEADLDRNLRTVVALGEPLVLIIMATVIGTVIVSIMLPIFSINDLIK